MTITQIASMNPIERAASIFNSLPAEIFCSRLGSFYDKPGARTIPIEPMRDSIHRNERGATGVPITARGRAHGPSPLSLVARAARDLRGFVLRLQPVVDVLAHHVFCQAIALLDLAFELVALAVDCGQIVVGELTPLLLDLAFGLLPVSFDAVPVHCHLHTLLVLGRQRRERLRVPAMAKPPS